MPRKRVLPTLAWGALETLLGLLMAATAGWGVLALGYFDHLPREAQAALAAGFGLLALVLLGGFIWPRWRWRSLLAYGVCFAGLLGAWFSLHPSSERRWQPEVALLPYATWQGDLVTVHNIRNFTYRTETDFTPAYYDKTFDLGQLDSVDLVTSYWMGPHIAHVFLTFGFGGKDHLAVSIEARKVAGEGYSSLKGFFRQYELCYIAADERDVIRLRTNYRRDPPEDVYLYPLRAPREAIRRVFEEYLRQLNDLTVRPEFYNTLTANCTSCIWLNSRVNPGHVPFSWKILLSGHVAEYLYEQGRLDRALAFPDLQRRSHINERAQKADRLADFSRQIRIPELAQ